MITDQPHYKTLSGGIQLALFYWTFPKNIFTPVVQHSCFSPQTGVKEPLENYWPPVSKQHHSISQKLPLCQHRGEDTIWSHSWLPSACGLYYLKSTTTILLTLSLSLLRAHVVCCDWNTAPLFQTSSPWLHTRSLFTLTTTIFTEIYHSYFYSLWYKTPNNASLLPLTWPRWGRGHG